MPKGYWVVHLEVNDLAGYKEYQAFVTPFLAINNGRFVVRGRVGEYRDRRAIYRTIGAS